MVHRTRVLVFAAAAALLLPLFHGAPAQAQGASDPKVLLDEIYGVVAETCIDTPAAGYDPLDLAQTYFTPRLAEKLNDASKAMKIDFDVFTDSQDCRVSDLDLKITAANDHAATGVARFKNYGEDRTVMIEMAKVDGAWRITDIAYGHRPFSLDKAVD